MSDYLIINGFSTADYDAYISAYQAFNAPTRDVDMINVKGKSGDLLLDNKRFKNIDIKYTIFIRRNFRENYEVLRDELLWHSGYMRIEDTMRPDIFRMGRVKGDLEPDIGRGCRVGSFDLTFDCKPQCWLKYGEIPIPFTSDGSLYNPTHFEAKPLIRVYGTGEFGIGDKTIKINKADGYTDLDCEIEEAFKDDSSINCNANISIAGYDFPKLMPGENGIRLGSGISRVEIIPRWWTV